MTDMPVQISGQMPEKTAGRLGEAIADLISPITETTGLIGDSLRYHREQMAQRRIAAAQEKAERLGLEVRKAPYKFVMGWIEGATIESLDSPLNELWENLLLAGITDYKSYLEMFSSILRELGGSEVTVLKSLALRSGPLDVGAHLVPAMAESGKFPSRFSGVIKSDSEPHIIWNNMRELDEEHTQNLVGAIFSEGQGQSYFYSELYHNNYVAFELLARERLIDINKAVAPAFDTRSGKFKDRTVEVVTASLTQLGISFARACMFPEQYAKPSKPR